MNSRTNHERLPLPAGLGAMVAVAALMTASCAPALDWRELGLEGTPVRMMLPCRPSTFARSVVVAGQTLQWTLLSCRSEGATWSLGHARVADAPAIGAVLRELGGSEPGAARLAWSAAGFVAHPDAGRWRWTHDSANGPRLRGESVVALHGPQVFRATVTGPQLDAESVEFFFGSLRVGR